MLGAEMPIIRPRIHHVIYWHDAKQLLDFTTKHDVAGYTAAAASSTTRCSLGSALNESRYR